MTILNAWCIIKHGNNVCHKEKKKIERKKNVASTRIPDIMACVIDASNEQINESTIAVDVF